MAKKMCPLDRGRCLPTCAIYDEKAKLCGIAVIAASLKSLAITTMGD